MAKERVVITGGAGFIGSNIARELLRRGYHVVILDNFSTGRKENLADIRSELDIVQGDIRHRPTLNRVFRRADYVLHQAAIPSVPRSINDPVTSHDANVNGTFNVLMAARDHKIKKVVLASSSSIYGNRKRFGAQTLRHKSEVMKPMPLSPYAVNKLIAEEYAKVFSHIFHVPTISLRYFNVFGHHQNPNSEYAAVIPKFITAMLRKERPVIYGDGTQSRDFTYIDNVVNANVLAMTSQRAYHGETVNIACGESISLRELVRHINRILRTHIRPKYTEARNGDVKDSLADIRKARRLIGYQPLIRFEDGLRRTVEWYLEHSQK